MFTWSLLTANDPGYEVTSTTEKICVAFLERLEMASIGHFERVIVEKGGGTRKLLVFKLNVQRFRRSLKSVKSVK